MKLNYRNQQATRAWLRFISMKIDIFNTDKKYSLILADPPWQCNDVKTGGSMRSGAAAKYRNTSTYDLCCIPVRYLLEDDAILFMWYLNAMPEDAIQMGKAWGFKKFLSMNGFFRR